MSSDAETGLLSDNDPPREGPSISPAELEKVVVKMQWMNMPVRMEFDPRAFLRSEFINRKNPNAISALVEASVWKLLTSLPLGTLIKRRFIPLVLRPQIMRNVTPKEGHKLLKFTQDNTSNPYACLVLTGEELSENVQLDDVDTVRDELQGHPEEHPSVSLHLGHLRSEPDYLHNGARTVFDECRRMYDEILAGIADSLERSHGKNGHQLVYRYFLGNPPLTDQFEIDQVDGVITDVQTAYSDMGNIEGQILSTSIQFQSMYGWSFLWPTADEMQHILRRDGKSLNALSALHQELTQKEDQ